MPDHRIRLDDAELALITAALYARAAALSAKSRVNVLQLAERLSEGGSGNPRWRFDARAGGERIAAVLSSARRPRRER